MSYTFQDWLENKPLSKDYAHRKHHFHKDSISMELLVHHGEMSKSDLIKVREAQEWTYDKSIEINLNTHKEIFLNDLEQSINPKKLRKLILKQIKSILEKHPEETKRVLRGTKYYFDIKAQDYLVLKDPQKKTSTVWVNDHSAIQFQLLFEKWMEGVSLPKDGIHDTAEKYRMPNGKPLYIRSVAMVCFFQKRGVIDTDKVLEEFGINLTNGHKQKLYEYYKGLPEGLKPNNPDDGQSRKWHRRHLDASVSYLESIKDSKSLSEAIDYQNIAYTLYS